MSFLFILGLAFFSGCAQSQIIPFRGEGGGPALSFAPTDPAQVGIYRSAHPFTNFTEMGLISFHIDALDLNAIYERLREDAAKQGADAIVDLKIKGETHTETSIVQDCSPGPTVCNQNGACTNEQTCFDRPVSSEVSTYFAAGTLIKRKK